MEKTLTESEKIEQLMRPRYRLSADYPGNSRPIGFVFTMDKKDEEGWYTTTGYLQEKFFTMYPHLFKPLSWWEDRAPEEMPKYLKDVNGVIEKGVWEKSTYKPNTLQFRTENAVWQGIDIVMCMFEPATEQEYLTSRPTGE